MRHAGGTSIQGHDSTSTGAYLGHSSYSSSLRYTIAADGRLRIEGAYVTTGGAGLRSVDAGASGTATLSPRGVLELRTGPDRAASPTWYVVRGWRQEGAATIMTVNGPWYPRADGSIDPDAFDPGRAVNLNEDWVRTR